MCWCAIKKLLSHLLTDSQLVQLVTFSEAWDKLEKQLVNRSVVDDACNSKFDAAP